ncbi:metallopeptidase family protein [Corynebacterium tapiri]|uniref:Metallopeptidase family protein n=1 Tax=Corynebacterium tapiri TaxID=1448266 RepID=A0A5C4U1F8_9CORY|nr:metallopeptidase family protein [Corynebacterium tapiri]TNL95601.1 metallopeptidase family protein [Corynebacterium tapiri]
MAYSVSEERFDSLVDDALASIPDALADHLGNVVILVRERNEEHHDLLGFYVGVPLTERTHDHTGYLPDTIFIYKAALEDMCFSEEQLAHEVKVTVMHEVAHYFGIEEDRLHELGWG